jgi:phenylpyruvate tautomerase PptA (4-oxalocrotonate tautomerase family)
MPMLDVEIPEGALSADAEHALLSRLTDVLLRCEGADPTDPRARSIAVVFVHRPAAVYIAGAPAGAPRYRVTASVPQGQFDDERRAAMVAAITQEVIAAEEGRHDDDPFRVWVFTVEIPEGSWGSGGRTWRLRDVAGFVLGDREEGRRYAETRLGG